MWYLQTRTLAILAAYTVAAAILRRSGKPKLYKPAGTILSIAALWLIEVRVCIYFVLYAALGIALTKLLHRFRNAPIFILCMIAAVAPFFAGRMPFITEAGIPIVTVGMAFGTLKLIDALFYVYYAGQKIDTVAFADLILFPLTFTAGPVYRYRDYLRDYSEPLKPDVQDYIDCVKRAIRGIFKKLVLERLAIYTLHLLLDQGQHWYISLAAIICGYLVIYFDLSGYSDIAIAFGRAAGYRVPENFKKPWTAATFTQFWRTWHSSFSDWIREHCMVVVGRRKLNRLQSAGIAMFIMCFMTLWYGFSLTYLLSGVYYGVLLAGENLLGLTTINRKKKKGPVYVLRCLAVNFLFALGTLGYYLPPQQALDIFRGVVCR